MNVGEYEIPLQLVSLKLKPIKIQTTPPTIRKRPMKSNSATCWRKVLP